MTNRDVASIVSTTQAYYDGPADEIYRSIWGDNIHLGVYCSEECNQLEAKQHTNDLMADAVTLGPDLRVLDLGCGYGSPARYLAVNFGYSVTGTNISEKELELARSRSEEAGLDHLFSLRIRGLSLPGIPLPGCGTGFWKTTRRYCRGSGPKPSNAPWRP